MFLYLLQQYSSIEAGVWKLGSQLCCYFPFKLGNFCESAMSLTADSAVHCWCHSDCKKGIAFFMHLNMYRGVEPRGIAMAAAVSNSQLELR
jgi:hypothetical protein